MDKLEPLLEAIVANGGTLYAWTRTDTGRELQPTTTPTISNGLDGNRQAWLQDPDGNRIELHGNGAGLPAVQGDPTPPVRGGLNAQAASASPTTMPARNLSAPPPDRGPVMPAKAYSLEDLAAEQEALALDRFDYDFAWKLGAAMRARAAASRAPVAIEIAHGTDLVFSILLPGATPDNSDLGGAQARRGQPLRIEARWRCVSRRRSRVTISIAASACRTRRSPRAAAACP